MIKKLLSAACLAAVITFAACKSSQQQIAYNTLYSLEQATQAAVDSYDSLVIKGTIPTNSVPKVSKAYNEFQAAFVVALDAVQYNTNAVAPPNLVIESQDVINLINTITGGAK